MAHLTITSNIAALHFGRGLYTVRTTQIYINYRVRLRTERPSHCDRVRLSRLAVAGRLSMGTLRQSRYALNADTVPLILPPLGAGRRLESHKLLQPFVFLKLRRTRQSQDGITNESVDHNPVQARTLTCQV